MLRFLALLALVAVAAASWVVRLGEASPKPSCAPARITSATPLYLVERHFGHPSASTFSGGGLMNAYVSRRHDWTVMLQIRPRPRRHP